MSRCTVVLTLIDVSCAFLQMMNSMGGDDLPDLDGADEEVCFLNAYSTFYLLHIILFQ